MNDRPAKARILVVDDERPLRELVTTALEFVDYEVLTATDGLGALAAARDFGPDLIVLDVGIPHVDGFDVCRRLRADGIDTPVIFLTARDAIDDTVGGFGAGGDDYLTKPFHLKELVARIDAVLKRSRGDDGRRRNGSALRAGHVELDDTTHDVRSNGEAVALSPTEYKLLRYLLLNAGTVVSKSQILDHVWQFDFGGDGSVVETYMSTLRRKVDRAEQKLIHTVRGFGYVIRAEVPS